MANGMLAGLNDSGSADSTTKSAVSEGTIVIRDKEKQTQDVAGLSRDVANANPGLDVIFDKEKEQNRLKAAQLIGEIGAQAGDIARTQGQIAGMKAQQDPAALAAAREELAKKGKLNPTADEIAKQAYDTAMKPFGTGSSLQQGISAVTAAVQGLSGGNVAQAISGASAPYLAEKIHELTTDANGKVNIQANLMAHAVLGAVTSYAAGNAALAGASGAMMGEYIAQQLYPGVKRSDLSEEQRQTISALGTLAAGLAGGVVGDSTADAVAGAQAGKNALEFNSLSGDKARETAKQVAESLKSQVREKLGEGTTSSIANGIINALADTGDAALGGADYAADAAMALASCATGDSYCGTALNDLSGKNQAVADSVKALMSSDTWSAVADTIKQASEGNQVALEATGGMLAGIILPGKKVPHVPNAGAVGNIGEFFKQSGFGSEIKELSKKTSKQYQGQAVYKANKSVGDYIKKGDQFYLDAKHKDHIEVFDSTGTKVKAVLNLDGSFNDAKTKAARAEGRRLPK
jgi:filamentous hemagglutinin